MLQVYDNKCPIDQSNNSIHTGLPVSAVELTVYEPVYQSNQLAGSKKKGGKRLKF
jgi:hypothetical protein